MADRGVYQGCGLGVVDDKGRVAIPAALRATLAGNAPNADGKACPADGQYYWRGNGSRSTEGL